MVFPCLLVILVQQAITGTGPFFLATSSWSSKVGHKKYHLPQFFIKPQLTSSCALFLHKNVFFAENTWVHQTERDWKELSVGLSDSRKGHAERLLMASHGNHGWGKPIFIHFLELQRLGDQREHEVPLARPLHICHACHDILPFIFGCNTRDCGWWRKLPGASWNCSCFRKESTGSKPSNLLKFSMLYRPLPLLGSQSGSSFWRLDTSI